MSDESKPVGQQSDDDPEEWPAPDPEELRLLEEHLDQLEKEGVLIKGEGIRGSFFAEASSVHTRRVGTFP